MTTTANVRIGVVGTGRGAAYARASRLDMGMELVAVCDTQPDRLQSFATQYGIPVFLDYDEFLQQEMDAVVIATYFHEHAPKAVAALQAGKHVLSEITANATLAEGVALCEAVEDSGCIYMMGENSAYTDFCQEMTRIYTTGEIGRVLYAEGEYNHPMAPETMLRLAPGFHHWRNWLPSTYYCTHALGPLMVITDTWPETVNALSIPAEELGPAEARINDPGSVILCRMDNQAVFRLFGIRIPGHSNWYRVHGTGGAMETQRGPGYFGPGQVRVWHDPWNCPAATPHDRTYLPQWPALADKELANKAHQFGHSGADFWVMYHFLEAVRTGRQPVLDVYRSVAMSSVGILAWYSALADGKPMPVPNFRDAGERAEYAADHRIPDPEAAPDRHLPASIRGEWAITPEVQQKAQAFWDTLADARN